MFSGVLFRHIRVSEKHDNNVITYCDNNHVIGKYNIAQNILYLDKTVNSLLQFDLILHVSRNIGESGLKVKNKKFSI